ncbi:OLC1v1035119C1 [Oldenlandia corymbosa var. corymbosa]|uniref:OLC1v1035119C1 n=1 Tax=Oldenlandia corymbosa var. corymbosa TaxID=529605 RepID=A0AAV1CTG8_OLDCO|nr:OLC1v1035119C1 [Oldenlandia corymbosa var. corymbosa]
MPVGIQDPIWERMWQLKLPNQTLLFAWRLCSNLLSTPSNLAARHVTFDDSCPFCNQNSVTNGHIFFDCSYAVQTFRITGLYQQISQLKRPNCEQWFRAIILENTFVSTSFFVALLSGIWYARNSAVFEQKNITPWSTVLHASRVVQDLASTSTNQARDLPELQAMNTIFQPVANAIQVFFDGSISSSNRCAGAGVYIQSSSGQFLHGLARQFPNVVDPCLSEALALREALLLCRQLDLVDVLVQGDSSIIILAAAQDSDSPSSCSPVLDDVIRMCQNLPVQKLSWVRREENVIAHNFAKFAKSSDVIETTWSDPPSFVNQSVMDLFQ